jgi:hypothetical protein
MHKFRCNKLENERLKNLVRCKIHFQPLFLAFTRQFREAELIERHQRNLGG